MCIESYFMHRYPDRDWSILSGILWLATEINWDAWMELYMCYIPLYFFETGEYDDELMELISVDTYQRLTQLYAGLTDGSVDKYDPSDELNYILRTCLHSESKQISI